MEVYILDGGNRMYIYVRPYINLFISLYYPHLVEALLLKLVTKITRNYSQYYTVAFCYVLKCELSHICLGHDIKLHTSHQVKLCRIGCVGCGLVLAKMLK